MDQASFEKGWFIGLRTAASVCNEGGHRVAENLLRRFINEWKSELENRAIGKRDMVPLDIFLERPLMTAADLGLDLPSPPSPSPQASEESIGNG